jgi:hypothetical protein
MPEMPARLYLCEALLEELAQHLQDVAPARRQFIQEEHAIVGQQHLARHRHVPPPISPASEMVWWGARHGRVVSRLARPGRPARRSTLWSEQGAALGRVATRAKLVTSGKAEVS